MTKTRTLTIEIDAEEYLRLAREAARHGVTPDSLAEQLVRAGINDAGSDRDAEREARKRRGRAALEALAALRAELRAEGYPSVDSVEVARQAREELDQRPYRCCPLLSMPM